MLEGRGMAVSWEMTTKLMLSEGHILMMFESWSWSQYGGRCFLVKANQMGLRESVLVKRQREGGTGGRHGKWLFRLVCVLLCHDL